MISQYTPSIQGLRYGFQILKMNLMVANICLARELVPIGLIRLQGASGESDQASSHLWPKGFYIVSNHENLTNYVPDKFCPIGYSVVGPRGHGRSHICQISPDELWRTIFMRIYWKLWLPNWWKPAIFYPICSFFGSEGVLKYSSGAMIHKRLQIPQIWL